MKQTLNNLLAVYKKKNPSIITKNFFYKKFLTRRHKLFRDLLKLPTKVFENTEVLDLPCGTGENSIIFSDKVKNLTCVDANLKALNLYKKKIRLMKVEKNKFQFINTSLEKFKLKKKFDIILFEGLLHHTLNPYTNFNKIIKFLKKDGFIIVGTVSELGGFQKILSRLLVFNNCKNSQEIIKFVKKYFTTELDRATKSGGRPVMNIIYDHYINPILKGLDFRKLFSIAKKNNLNYYSSFPNLETHSVKNTINDRLNSDDLMSNKFYSLKELTNLLSTDIENSKKISSKKLIALNKKLKKIIKSHNIYNSNYKSQLNNFNLESIKKVNDLFVEVINEESNDIKKKFQFFFNDLLLLKKNNLNTLIKHSKNIFKGSNGVPINYIVFYKK